MERPTCTKWIKVARDTFAACKDKTIVRYYIGQSMKDLLGRYAAKDVDLMDHISMTLYAVFGPGTPLSSSSSVSFFATPIVACKGIVTLSTGAHLRHDIEWALITFLRSSRPENVLNYLGGERRGFSPEWSLFSDKYDGVSSRGAYFPACSGKMMTIGNRGLTLHQTGERGAAGCLLELANGGQAVRIYSHVEHRVLWCHRLELCAAWTDQFERMFERDIKLGKVPARALEVWKEHGRLDERPGKGWHAQWSDTEIDFDPTTVYTTSWAMICDRPISRICFGSTLPGKDGEGVQLSARWRTAYEDQLTFVLACVDPDTAEIVIKDAADPTKVVITLPPPIVQSCSVKQLHAGDDETGWTMYTRKKLFWAIGGSSLARTLATVEDTLRVHLSPAGEASLEQFHIKNRVSSGKTGKQDPTRALELASTNSPMKLGRYLLAQKVRFPGGKHSHFKYVCWLGVLIGDGFKVERQLGGERQIASPGFVAAWGAAEDDQDRLHVMAWVGIDNLLHIALSDDPQHELAQLRVFDGNRRYCPDVYGCFLCLPRMKKTVYRGVTTITSSFGLSHTTMEPLVKAAPKAFRIADKEVRRLWCAAHEQSLASES
ncbi:uncharacterized protein STEHIDRAFT_164130 [Stereum hirsutum FP-91666 SS1]|uniref:Uncharacterized protein n=1 Tax=Stereum hirsutum (strain FP-91666) TaxID=721885 RepID=R7RX74_STEHR|nr:uncharacterized protein STEHIDRAFT_164130 [Stereum hirsutum FP-91666 SS1]EIM78982.1 hypothetical protein STEHIDRAFT_164130 [Stereum hirsutum FP-91666 SS1]